MASAWLCGKVSMLVWGRSLPPWLTAGPEQWASRWCQTWQACVSECRQAMVSRGLRRLAPRHSWVNGSGLVPEERIIGFVAAWVRPCWGGPWRPSIVPYQPLVFVDYWLEASTLGPGVRQKYSTALPTDILTHHRPTDTRGESHRLNSSGSPEDWGSQQNSTGPWPVLG